MFNFIGGVITGYLFSWEGLILLFIVGAIADHSDGER